MMILAGFLSYYLVDFIVIAITIIFLIIALILEFKVKHHSSDYANKYSNINHEYGDADSRYKATDLLVENFEDGLIDEIDRSIKDLEIDNFYDDSFLFNLLLRTIK